MEPLAHKTSKLDMREAILYALALGVSKDALDVRELEYTYESAPGFRAFPTFHCILNQHYTNKEFFAGIESVLAELEEANGQQHAILHAEQHLEIFEALEFGVEYRTERRVAEIVQKRNGILVTIENQHRNALTQRVASRIVVKVLVVNAYSSKFPETERRGAAQLDFPREVQQSHPLRFSYEHSVDANQALLYRLVGEQIDSQDCNPIHVDPQRSLLAGLQRPILHGLCTFGIALLGLLRTLRVPDKSVELVSCRFVGVVFPGEILHFDYYSHDERSYFFVGKAKDRLARSIIGEIRLKVQPKL